MGRRHLLFALGALGISGCWTSACVERDPILAIEACQEYLSGIFDDPPATSLVSCHGTLHDGTCPANGFTVQCGYSWVKPESAGLAACR